MQGKTIHYQIGHELWKVYFSRFTSKNKYMMYILLALLAFAVIYSICLDRISAGNVDQFMIFLFLIFAACFAAFFVKMLRGSMPGPQTERYEKQLKQQYGTKDLHYELKLGEDGLSYGCRERKQRLKVPYRSVNLLVANKQLLCIHAGQKGNGIRIVCPAGALEGGVQPLIDFLTEKNPDCKVKHI